MKDDGLDDTGIRKVKIMYGGKPIAQAIADGDTKTDRECKPDAIKALAKSNNDIRKLGRVDTDRINNVYYKEVWNAAIEAAAEHCDGMGEEARISENIRGLKK